MIYNEFTKDYNNYFPALGAEGRKFESFHPDG